MRTALILAFILIMALLFWAAHDAQPRRKPAAASRAVPAELSHDEMMREQERRDRAVEEERERDDL